ncbi:hypothetical protein FACS189468_5510 [Spirochaetia bacterium]|nr:hypothetical protein FACS189468_5510 [Spirochaetia bacterium]
MMNMTRYAYLYFWLAAIGAALSFSCASASPFRESNGMSAELLKLVETSVFEVVVEKPQTDSLVYDRELTWELVPYAARTDKYASIGTAFAIEGWDEFIALNTEPSVRYLPEFLGDFKFDWKSDTQEVSIEADAVFVNAGEDVFEWSPRSELFIAPCWYQTTDLRSADSQENEIADQYPAEQVPADLGQIKFGVDKFNLYRDTRHQEYLSLYKHIKPDPRLGTIAAENWNDKILAKNPYDEKPRIFPNDTGSVGAILRMEPPNPDVLYTLYLSMEDPQDEENLSRRFSALKAGIRVKK